MAREGNYYIFHPPFSASEYFVKVTDIRRNEEDQNTYVYYEHLLEDTTGSYEQSYFNKGSKELDTNRISRIIKNISEEIEDLREKMSDFNKVLDKIKEDKGELADTNENGTKSSASGVKERDIERVKRESSSS